MSAPLSEMHGAVRALFTDLDGTLTTAGRVEAETFAALERLGTAGVPLIIVTGRPAGWGQALMTLVPVAAVVAEAGGVSFVRRGGALEKIYGVSAATLPDWRRRMHAAAVDVMTQVPGAKLSADSKYREVDLAIDWNEETSLTLEAATEVVSKLEQAGFSAVRSSVHVNFGPPLFDKLSACRRIVSEVLRQDSEELSPFVFVGDALNDAPMFAGFPRSVGVANIRSVWEELAHKPSYLADAAEGPGLREVIQRILELNRGP